MDRVTFAHFEALLAAADSHAALDRVAAELRDYLAACPGDPVAEELTGDLAAARRALGAAPTRASGQ